MRAPVLVEAPSAPVVSLPELKAHLRVDDYDSDVMIEAMHSAAVAYLDGWHGILGRAIMPQKWKETFTCHGPHRLTLPDATEITVTVDGEAVPGPIIGSDALGWWVEPSYGMSPDATVIEYSCALPAQQLPAAQAAVMLYVEHLWEGADLSPAFHSLVSMLRWRVV